MNKTISFAKLDLLTIKPYMNTKFLVILLFVAFIVGYSIDNTASLIGILMVYGSLFISYPFAVGDKNGIDMLYFTLSLKRNNVVIGRYIFALAVNLAVAIFAFSSAFIISTVLNRSFNINETLFTTLLCFLIFTFIQAFQLPIYFKLGYAKAKLLAYMPLAIFPMVLILVSSLFDKNIFKINLTQITNWIYANLETALVSAIIFWILIYIASCRLSCSLYRKREF